MRDLLADGSLMVVETEDDIYLGTAEITEDGIVVRNGYVGRPVVVPATEVMSIIPAQGHPDVES